MYLPTPSRVSTGLSGLTWVVTFDVEDEDGNAEEAHVVVNRKGPPSHAKNRVIRRRKPKK